MAVSISVEWLWTRFLGSHDQPFHSRFCLKVRKNCGSVDCGRAATDAFFVEGSWARFLGWITGIPIKSTLAFFPNRPRDDRLFAEVHRL